MVAITPTRIGLSSKQSEFTFGVMLCLIMFALCVQRLNEAHTTFTTVAMGVGVAAYLLGLVVNSVLLWRSFGSRSEDRESGSAKVVVKR